MNNAQLTFSIELPASDVEDSLEELQFVLKEAPQYGTLTFTDEETVVPADTKAFLFHFCN
jgi:uncharacterized protein YjbK